jgi:hypothetical protein
VTAAEVLPQPKAAIGVVFNDPATRTLTVRLSDEADGYTRLLWQQGWQQLRRAQEAGWPANGAPWVWADAPGSHRTVHGVPGDGGVLSFHWPIGSPGYAELVGKPGLTAIATVDRGTHHILSVRFLHGPAPSQ